MDMDKEYILSNPKGCANSRYIKINYINEYNDIITYPGKSFPEQLYNYFYNCPQHICPVCGKETPFRNIIHGYSEFCSVNCSYKGKSRIEKSKQTCLKKYGVTNPSQSKEIQKKKQETWRSNFLKTHDIHIGFDDNGNWICKCPHPECDKCEEKIFIVPQQVFNDRRRNQSEPCTKL